MKGRYLSLSVPRRIVSDLMYFSAGVPWIVVEREFDLAKISQAREANVARPGWAALFVKAYAIVSQEMPELRRVYMKFPWAHLYEYPAASAAVAVSRQYGNEQGLTFVHIGRPAQRPLRDINEKIRAAKAPGASNDLKSQRMERTAKLPFPLRRVLWWLALNIGFAREKLFGTFGLSSIAGSGAEILQLRTLQTTALTYGPLDSDGKLKMRLVFDHRVIDAMTAAKALVRLEEIMRSQIAEELGA
jgi:hypothetical protein